MFNNFQGTFISMSNNKKKEIIYFIENDKIIHKEYEYGHSLLSIFDTNTDEIDAFIENLKKLKYSDSEIKTFKNNLITNYKFVHRLLNLDLALPKNPKERYHAITSIMSDSEKILYFKTKISSQIMELSSKVLPTIAFNIELDLTGIIIVYLTDLIYRDVHPIKCKNCNKPFFPMGKAIYCNRIIYFKDDKNFTCKYIGAHNTYDDSLYTNNLKSEYRKAYKKFFARKRHGKLSTEEFNIWSLNARTLLKLAEKSKISYEEFKKKLQ